MYLNINLIRLLSIVNILVNNTMRLVPYYITPEVTLYVTGVSELKNEVLEQYKNHYR